VVVFIIRNEGNYTISFAIGESSSTQEVVPFSTAHASVKARWDEWFNRIPPVSEEYERTYAYAWWIMGNNLISPAGKIAYEAMAPSKKRYVGIWLWDCAMHALAYRHVDPELARNQIRAMIACQLPNGMIPDAIFDEGIVTEIDHPIQGKVTKPPILAWAALKIHEVAPDNSFLEEIYNPLIRWNDWWFSMNDDDADGLVQYNHPYSSGLDNNPLWDYGMPVESPDINTYLCIQMKSLAEMADILGMEAEGATWRKRASDIVERMMDTFWDEQVGVFQALYDGRPVPVLTPFNLIPIWTGQLSHPVTVRLVSHLTNPNEFWGGYPLPTVARNDPHYDPEAMWRGPVWANVNYFFIEALNQIGETKLADELRDKTLKLIKAHRSICEYYNAENGEPPESAVDAFGWSAAVFIDLAIQANRGKT
jgi:putative isomerase